jgi:hypothetical protein
MFDRDRFVIDIGCSYETNIPLDIISSADVAIFCECDDSKADKMDAHLPQSASLIRKAITPHNVVDTIKSVTDRTDPTFLDLDIDGYDYFVLEAILKSYSPTVIMAEINEKIPPPIRFAVKYSEGYKWDASHFFGMSLSKLKDILDQFGYDLVDLTYNNAFAIRKDMNPGLKAYSADDAYGLFYRNKDWRKWFPWNANVGHWLELDPAAAIDAINGYFSEHAGMYEIG